MRFVLYTVGTFFVYLLYAFLLLKLEFATLYNPDHDQVYELNNESLKIMMYTVPFIGIMWASRSKIVRIVAVLLILFFWIWPLFHWCMIGAPNPARV
ncbi:hypothetical protein C7459_101217 [Tumebacillus permanentifrigoris]|uniref:Uncharacterized protein n=1 Tax=Tumebacillus permanentifrigoris TaxID=378543 RepID=A0A316DI92_9BACL|nr:hypothetical protein C7459_101217 [Tumebacillus permanentifrigoris]